MASAVITIPEEIKAELKRFSWVNWSEAAKEELVKKEIFERYLKTGEVTDKDWEFCESIDWHPVDELPPKPEHIEELKKALKEPSIRYNSVEEFFESIK